MRVLGKSAVRLVKSTGLHSVCGNGIGSWPVETACTAWMGVQRLAGPASGESTSTYLVLCLDVNLKHTTVYDNTYTEVNRGDV